MENNEEIKEETIGTQDGQAVKQKKGFKSRLNSFFKISERGSSVAVEVFAGLTTFLSMCYILAVCPMQILGQLSPDDPAQASLALALQPSVFIATALCAVIGTTMMALFAKMPLAQASGLGISAMVGGMIGASAEQVIGGLIGSCGLVNKTISSVKDSFAFNNLIQVEISNGAKRAGGLIGVREQGVLVENCFAGNDFPCIAYGDFNGAKVTV